MDLIGTTALIIIDIQHGELMPPDAHGIPPIFIQEVHEPSLIDFGRELDGTETVHCVEGDPATELAKAYERPGAAVA